MYGEARADVLSLESGCPRMGFYPITFQRRMKAGRIQVIQGGWDMGIARTDIGKSVGTLDGRPVVLSAQVSGPGAKSGSGHAQ
jgi:predicted site-specific integrase-resolvase